ncbi:MAG: Dabb family protein [Chitinispirillaceae bacterium]|nr:Dabb family protein [Chitinispirillaceae bacterium]
MVRHIVLWKLAESAEGAVKQENAQKMKVMLEGLRDKIPEIRMIEVGTNCNRNETWDVALFSEFDSLADLLTYQNNPEHRVCVEFIRKVRVERAAVDYDVG